MSEAEARLLALLLIELLTAVADDDEAQGSVEDRTVLATAAAA